MPSETDTRRVLTDAQAEQLADRRVMARLAVDPACTVLDVVHTPAEIWRIDSDEPDEPLQRRAGECTLIPDAEGER